MDTRISKTSIADVIRDGVFGGGVGLFLFLPSCWLSAELWDFVFFDILKKGSNINIDDFISILFVLPIAFVAGTLLGILGGYLGSRLSRSERGEVIGSLIGGFLGGLLTANWITFNIISGWASY